MNIARDPEPGIAGVLQRTTASFSLWWTIPLIFLLFSFWFVKAHDHRLSYAIGLWPLLGLNFFMADMQSGIGPFLGVFLLAHGWQSGWIGTAITLGSMAGMIITIPIGAIIDAMVQITSCALSGRPS